MITAIKTLNKRGQHNWTKIVCLAIELVALLIALIGLIGYLAGEIGRRQKEIVIRKVNGARTADVLRLFITDILRVALPAVLIGVVLSNQLKGQSIVNSKLSNSKLVR